MHQFANIETSEATEDSVEVFEVVTPPPPSAVRPETRTRLPSYRGEFATTDENGNTVKTTTATKTTPTVWNAVNRPSNHQPAQDNASVITTIHPLVADDDERKWWKTKPDDDLLDKCGLIKDKFRALRVHGKELQPAKGDPKKTSTAFAAWAVLATLGPMKLDAIRKVLWRNESWGANRPQNQTIRKALSKGVNFVSEKDFWRLRNIGEGATRARPQARAQAQAQAQVQASAKLPTPDRTPTPSQSSAQKQTQKRAAEDEKLEGLPMLQKRRTQSPLSPTSPVKDARGVKKESAKASKCSTVLASLEPIQWMAHDEAVHDAASILMSMKDGVW